MLATIGLYLFSIIFFIFFVLHLYARLTLGICKCSKHLVGKVAIVTGGNAGIGYETAKNFAERGARVILACRNEQRGITARDKIINETGKHDVHFKKLDLASFASVREFAADINKNEKHVDILVNNAGVIMGNKKEMTEDGLLLGMQTNHFGPFLLTNLLLDKLKASGPSRIVNVSSLGHMSGKLDFDNLNLEKSPPTIEGFEVYKTTKLCNILTTLELAKRLKGTEVTTYSLCPGAVATEIVYDIKTWYHRLIMPLATRLLMKSAWEGAQCSIYCAVSPEVKDLSGEYFSDCSVTRFARSKTSTDENLARKLWEVSEKLCKLSK